MCTCTLMLQTGSYVFCYHARNNLQQMFQCVMTLARTKPSWCRQLPLKQIERKKRTRAAFWRLSRGAQNSSIWEMLYLNGLWTTPDTFLCTFQVNKCIEFGMPSPSPMPNVAVLSAVGAPQNKKENSPMLVFGASMAHRDIEWCMRWCHQGCRHCRFIERKTHRVPYTFD